jgi:hypothetical protein
MCWIWLIAGGTAAAAAAGLSLSSAARVGAVIEQSVSATQSPKITCDTIFDCFAKDDVTGFIIDSSKEFRIQV